MTKRAGVRALLAVEHLQKQRAAERVRAEDVEPVSADVRGGAGYRVKQLLHRGADAVLGRSPARWRPHGLRGTREVDEDSAFSVVEVQRRASASSTLSEAPASSPRSRRG